MSLQSPYASFFSGFGMYVPENVVKNDDLSKWMDTSDEWIRTRSGIEERRWVDGNLSTSDLALKASLKALEKANLKPTDLDAIIVATLSPDHDFPGVACFLQAKLGLSGCAAIDVRQQCSGFIYAASIADQFIKSGQYKHVLVVGAELQSRGIDKTTEGRDVAVLFGDGAGAAVMSRASDGAYQSKKPHVISSHLHADGAFAKELWVEAPTQTDPEGRITKAMIDSKKIFPKMNGKVVFMNAVKRMPETLMANLKQQNLSLSDVDLFMFHQANLRINESIAKALEIPAHKIFNTIQKYGNTTAATIPIGLAEAEKAGVLKPGMLVACAAFGSGFTWGSLLFRT